MSTMALSPTDLRTRGLTPRALAAGLAIGVLMCLTNMYFGLQTGWITMGSLQSAILGFGIFKALQGFGLGKQFSVAENVIVQTTSVATATMPLAAGFVGVIPAMAMLTADENPPDGPYTFTPLQLILWSLSLACFGVFVAVPLRAQVIEREQLRFPSGTATAHVIAALHAGEQPGALQGGQSPEPRALEQSISHTGSFGLGPSRGNTPPNGWSRRSVGRATGGTLSRPLAGSEVELMQSVPKPINDDQHGDDRVTDASTLMVDDDFAVFTEETPVEESASFDGATLQEIWRSLFLSFAISFLGTGVLDILGRFNVPTKLAPFGALAGKLGWRFTFNAGYVGQGMIMGPRVCASMLIGTIVAFAGLAPLALRRGWASNPDNRGVDSAQAWVIWVSMAIMIADSLTSLGVLLARYAASAVARRRSAEQQAWDGAGEATDEADGLVAAAEPRGASASQPSVFEAPRQQPPPAPAARHGDIPASLWLPGLGLSALAAMTAIHFMFAMAVLEVALAALLALLVAVLAVRALGDTDVNPVSGIGKLTQLAFAAVTPGQVLPNLVAGAVTEAAAQQAGDMMQDFKTAHLLRVCPLAQFWAMLAGSVVSCFVSTGAFLLYSSVYTIGEGKLTAPTAKVWLDMAKLVNGGALPHGVTAFCWAGAAFGLMLGLLPEVVSAVAHRAETAGQRARRVGELALRFMPSGIGFAIGMYVSPEFVVPRVLGSLGEQVWLAAAPRSHKSAMLVTASGLVLGEGIATLILTLMRFFADAI